MADQLPVNFPIPNENVIASYSFQDLAQSVAYGEYQGVIGRDGTAILSPVGMDTDNTYFMITNGEFTSPEETNFDLLFNVPVVIRGKLYVSATYGSQGNGSASSDASVTVEVFHVNGAGTETTIGTQQTGETCSSNAVAPGKAFRKLFVFDIARTNFSIGEKLRIEVTKIYALGAGGGARFYFDGGRGVGAPQNPAGTSESAQGSDFVVMVPYEVKV